MPAEPTGRTCPRCGYGGDLPNAHSCGECGEAFAGRQKVPLIWFGGLAAILVTAVVLWQTGWLQERVSGPPARTAETVLDAERPSPTVAENAAPTPGEMAPPPTSVPTLPKATPTPVPTDTPVSTATPTATAIASPSLPPMALTTATDEPSDANAVEVGAAVPRNLTGLYVVAGQQLSIEYVGGHWRAGGSSSWPMVGPRGDDQVPHEDTFPVDGAQLMSLIGGIGGGRPFLVGEGVVFESADSGYLWLGANDDNCSDNGGSLTVRVTLDVGPVDRADLPPTGRVVFTCFIGGYDDLCVIGADGSGERRLTRESATDWYASFAPDGQEIFFSSRRDGSFELYHMNVDGSNQRRMSENLGGIYAPSVSPDGGRIVFTAAYGKGQNIWVMNVDGSQAEALTNTDDNNVDPVWSPDGMRIAFASDRTGEIAHYVMSADGSALQMIRTEIEDIGGRSDWSPDGQWLAFYAGEQDNREIYMVRADGSEVRRLTDGGNNVAPSFSPDGNWIAFMSKRDGDAEIFIMRPYGADVTQITFNYRPDWQPRWGP